jgi:type IX secretion system PorP/SprF family membrane protein
VGCYCNERRLKKILIYLALFVCPFIKAQQTTNYIQYIFNKAGINPAAAGTNINQKYYYCFGGNRQWLGFDNSPKATFVNFSYTIRPPRSYSYWQNVGVMVESDQSGAISNAGFYANYTIHLLLRKNLVTSFGIFAGARQFFISPGIIEPNDPIYRNGNYKTLVYPDLVPGMRLSNKRFFIDICARQLTVIKQEDFKGNGIGGPSYLNPSIFFAYGQVFPVSEDMIMLPSVSVNMAIFGPPSISPTLMFYYGNRFGFGASARNATFLNGIFQVRIFENMSVGLAYSYSINKVGSAARNGYEIMVGVVPMGLGGKFVGGRSIAKCPVLEF